MNKDSACPANPDSSPLGRNYWNSRSLTRLCQGCEASEALSETSFTVKNWKYLYSIGIRLIRGKMVGNQQTSTLICDPLFHPTYPELKLPQKSLQR